MGRCCSEPPPTVETRSLPSPDASPQDGGGTTIFPASLLRASFALAARQRATPGDSQSDSVALFTPWDNAQMSSSTDMLNSLRIDGERDLTLSVVDTDPRMLEFSPPTDPRDVPQALVTLQALETDTRSSIGGMYDVLVTLMGLYSRRITPLFRVVPASLTQRRSSTAGGLQGGSSVRRLSFQDSLRGRRSVTPDGVLVCHEDIATLIDVAPAGGGGGIGAPSRNDSALGSRSGAPDGRLSAPSPVRTSAAYLAAINSLAQTPVSPLAPPPGEADSERVEILALDASDIPPSHKTTAHLVTPWDTLSLPNSKQVLNSGDAFFKFMCQPLSALSEEDLNMIGAIVNESAFDNEVSENGVPFIDVSSPADLAEYITIVVRAMYLLPCERDADFFTAALLSSLDYQRSCQPGKPKFFDVDKPLTFRQTKPVIPWVYTLTVQFRVSDIVDHERLSRFSIIDGMCPTRAILMERTKRNSATRDSTAKVKSLLLYYSVTGGVLVSHITVVMNTALPTIISKVIQTFGGQGSAETAETADSTRKFIARVTKK